MLETRILGEMQRAVDENELAGCNLEVVKDGRSLIRLEAGYKDLASGEKITHDSIFRLYSQTKPITAAAIALLMERGRLDPCCWAQDFLPGFRNQKVRQADGSLKPASRPVTVSDLLSMTAGLMYPGATEAEAETSRLFYENELAMQNGGGMGTVEFANALGRTPLAFEPGSAFRYSSCADVLGAIVEVADGRPFSRFLKEEFFEPLEMEDTGFYVPEDKRTRFVSCYKRENGALVPFNRLHLCVGDYTREPAFASGGAGLVSTLDDYANFARMLLDMGEFRGRRILSRRTVEWLTSPQLDARLEAMLWDHLRGYSYGKLMRICVEPGRAGGLASRGEYGWDGWLGTYFANLPGENMTILFNQNTTDTGTSPLVRKIRNMILAQM